MSEVAAQLNPRLDKIDQQIVIQLGRNGRMSGRQLSALLPIDEGATRIRMQRLLTSIMNVKALVNPDLLGYPIRTFLGLRVRPANVSDGLKRLAEEKRSIVVMGTVGAFDAVALVASHSHMDLYNFMDDPLGRLVGIRGVEANVCLQSHLGHFIYMPPELLSEVDHTPTGIDETDLSIIRLLINDGRLSARELARRLEISLLTAHRRLKRLLDDRIITIRSVLKINDLGFPVVATLGLKVEPDKIQGVAKTLAINKQATFVATCAGRYNILCTGMFKSNGDLDSTLKNFVYPIPGVESVDTIVGIDDMLVKRTLHVPRCFGFE